MYVILKSWVKDKNYKLEQLICRKDTDCLDPEIVNIFKYVVIRLYINN